MKNFFAVTLAFAILIFSSQVQAAVVTIDYGDSKTFTKREINSCITTIQEELERWNCTLLRVRYVGDEISNSKENISYLNELAESRNFKPEFCACLVFQTDFMSPPDPHDGKITAWDYDTEYKDFTWYFGFYQPTGEWKLLTSGY